MVFYKDAVLLLLMSLGEDVVVVGGGPAGGYCASELAKKGFHVSIFDDSHPREKPCGGGITSSVIENFPWVERFRSFGQVLSTFRILSCTNRQIVTGRLKIAFAISRRRFDEEILNMAVQNGATWIKERVVAVEDKRGVLKIKTCNRLVSARIVVGADGVNSVVRRKKIGQMPRENVGVGYGFLAKGIEDEIATIKFLGSFPGYIWVFPRRDHTCVGIGGESKHGHSFKSLLDEFTHSFYPKIRRLSTFAAMMPLVTNTEFFSLPCAGKNWVLVGDAAGHSDPITGEGILYALLSGKLAAEAIELGDSAVFDSLWRKEYGDKLKMRCMERESFYDPLNLELMVALAGRNSSSVIGKF